MRLVKWFFNRWYRIRPPEMVNYWMHGDVARAKVIHAQDGSYRMQIEGEKYPYPGFPRGHVLFNSVARLKNRAKNLVFNDIWARLEAGEDRDTVRRDIKGPITDELIREIERVLPDMIPPEKMVPAMQELWRAMSEAEKKFPSEKFTRLKQGLTFFLQEDDAYRFRFQWATKFLKYYRFFKKIDLRRDLEKALKFLENAEIVPDMKGRMKLIARIAVLILEDGEFNAYANEVIKQMKFNRVKLSKADKYYFRGKYFKVEHLHYEY